MGRGQNKSKSKISTKSSQAEPKQIKVWLDDDLVDRAAPEGWIHVTTAQKAIELLKTGNVVELSLDHDLGDDELYGRGVDVVDFLCEKAFNKDPVWPKEISLHTANPYGRDSMMKSLTRYNPAYKTRIVSGQPVLTTSTEKE